MPFRLYNTVVSGFWWVSFLSESSYFGVPYGLRIDSHSTLYKHYQTGPCHRSAPVVPHLMWPLVTQ